MGDARLECRSIGIRHPVTARLRIHHGDKQRGYVFWKYEALKNLVLKPPQTISWINPKRNLHEVSWYFHTKSLKEFGALHGFFYREGVKILPRNIFEIFTPKMIAVWFMDDGSNTKESFTLNTHGFSQGEQLEIVDYFKNSHGIQTRLVKDRDKWKISFGRYEYQKFTDLVEPFIIPSMTYKIENPRNDLVAISGRS